MDGGNSSSIFGNNSTPTGDYFKDPVLVAAIAVNGLCALSFAILWITACSIGGKKEKGRKVFGVLNGVVFTLLLSYLRTTADEITLELNATSTTVQIALFVIEQVLSAGTDSALPFILYHILQNRFSHVANDEIRYRHLKYMHLGIALLLALFRVVDSFLMSYGDIFIEINEPEMAWSINISNWYRNIHITYAVLFCAVTLEMIACAVFIFKRAENPSSSQSLSKSRTPTYLLALVLPPLLIRSLANLALAIVYTYLDKPTPKSNGLLAAVLLGVPSVVLYTGLVLVGLQKDWNLPAQPSSYVEGPRVYPEPQMQNQGYGGGGVSYQHGRVKAPISNSTVFIRGSP